MAQVIVGRPLYEFKLPDKKRFQPYAVPHFGRGKPGSPASASGFRKIRKRALVGRDPPEFLRQFLAQFRRESIPRSGCIDQFLLL